jgi:hypothetical protein
MVSFRDLRLVAFCTGFVHLGAKVSADIAVAVKFPDEQMVI